jgi:hypothetical protein
MLPNEPDPQPSLPAKPPRLTPERFSKPRLLLAFAIAGISDAFAAGFTFIPPLEWGLDLVTAFLLFMVLGWRWMLLPGLILEAIPGLSAFPFWVLVVAAVAVSSPVRPGTT